MSKYIIIFVLGIALFLTAGWGLGLFDKTPVGPTLSDQKSPPPADPAKLGEYLYAPKKYDPAELPKWKNADPIVLPGLMNAFETEEVPSQVAGRVLFIGDQVDDSAVLAAGSAAFLAEPYYFASIYAGRQSFVKFYRRHYENEVVRQGQMLGMIEPSKALGAVLEKIAKVSVAEAEYQGALAAEKEGETRKKTADLLFARGTMAREDHGAAILTYIKLSKERSSAAEKIEVAKVEKDQADIDLRMHEIRAVLPYKNYTIKSIQRTAGTFLKQLDPVVMTVQTLERMMAEALIEEQYAARLERRPHITATIEPTILEAPRDYLGPEADVNCIAVAKNMKIVAGSEDKRVFIWALDGQSPERTFDHDSPVRILACSPPGAKENYCIVGCEDGTFYAWNLDKDDVTPIKPAEKAHGNDARITALAFSPDGKYFASGASDGSIKLWTTEDLTEKYAFVPQNGVDQKQIHEDAVTALTFTPQCRLISAGRDKTLRVWHLKEKGAHLDGKEIRERKGNIGQLGVSQDGQWMLFDQPNSMKLYSVEKKTYVHSLNLPPNAAPFETLAIFSPEQVRPDGSSAGTLMLTAGAPEGRMQLWRTPDAKSRGFEVRQFATKQGQPVTCAAFSPDAGKGGEKSFAVSASGQRIHLWAIPTPAEVDEHRITNVPLTLKTRTLDPSTKQTRVGFEIANPVSERYPHGRFEAGRPVVIVID